MQNLKFAFSSIMAHKMRSLLTMIWDYYRCFISCCDYGFG
ncbi:Cell division protein FtsX [Streptococcus pneumoniae]|nr:Cell division protein FtsX [Streptococcus pneumoniae]